MAEAYKGYSLNEYLEANWYTRENTLFKAIIDRLPNSGLTLVTTQHVHSKLVSSDAAIDPSIACDVNGRLIVGNGLAAGDTLLHVWKASAGLAAAANAAAVATLESDGNMGLQFLSPNTSGNTLYFGDPEDNDVGMIRYDHSGNNLAIYVNAAKAMQVDSNGRLLMDAVWALSSADSLIHLASGSAGAVTALAGTLLTIEGFSAKYISFLADSSGGGQESGLVWGDDGDNDEAGVRYHNGTLRLNFYVDSALQVYVATTGLVMVDGRDIRAGGAAGLRLENDGGDGVLVADNGDLQLDSGKYLQTGQAYSNEGAETASVKHTSVGVTCNFWLKFKEAGGNVVYVPCTTTAPTWP